MKLNKKYLKFLISILYLIIILKLNAQKIDFTREIIKKCIKRHGGLKKFKNIHDIYAKMKVRTFSKEGDIESTFYEYFRKPDKLRIDMYPGMEPPTKIGWDGKNAWQLVKDKLEKTANPKQIKQIQESLRFIKLMILTNLLNKDSKLILEAHLKKEKFGIYVISQIDKNNEKIWLYISDKTYTLLGAQFLFTWKDKKSLFSVKFSKHRWYNGMFLPRFTKLYRNKKLIMEAKLSLVKINALKNKNTFFSNLREKPKIKKKRRSRYYRRY